MRQIFENDANGSLNEEICAHVLSYSMLFTSGHAVVKNSKHNEENVKDGKNNEKSVE